jgi:hypothetical protein
VTHTQTHILVGKCGQNVGTAGSHLPACLTARGAWGSLSPRSAENCDHCGDSGGHGNTGSVFGGCLTHQPTANNCCCQCSPAASTIRFAVLPSNREAVIFPHRPREEIRDGLSRGLSRTRMARRSFIHHRQAEQPSAVGAEAQQLPFRLPPHSGVVRITGQRRLNSRRSVVPALQRQAAALIHSGARRPTPGSRPLLRRT